MINPSINGWIEKYFVECNSTDLAFMDENHFYDSLFQNGFLFGNIIKTKTKIFKENNILLDSEIAKVVFLEAMIGIYAIHHNSTNDFIIVSNAFFKELNPHKGNILEKILPKNSDSLNLEKNISERIHINESLISKNFSNLITNAFLFVDILAFQQFLLFGKIPEKYLKKIEEAILSIVVLVLKTKSSKSKHDDLMIKIFESSVRYSKFSEIKIQNIGNSEFEIFDQTLEKKYLIDLASLTIWSDEKLENNEVYFLQKLAESLSISDEYVQNSISKTNDFIHENKSEILFLKSSNAVKNYYDQTTQNVATLIIRNKKRLYKELTQSKELLYLLALSTKRDLDEQEKKKIKKQLLDICKTIPSLTIFLIPGGSLLLPILIKFIPQLLPSAFNENLDSE